MKSGYPEPFTEFFDYTKFLSQFHGEYYSTNTLPFLTDYYQTEYPSLSLKHIKILIEDVSLILIGDFANNGYREVFNHYFILTMLLKKNLAEESFNKYLLNRNVRAQASLRELKAYKEADEEFVINKFEEERQWRHPNLAVVNNPADYVPMIKELIQERGSVILSYVYNYLIIMMPQRFKDKNIITPLPPATPLKVLISEPKVRIASKIKQVKFFDKPVVYPIHKHNKAKKVGRKRTRDGEIVEQSEDKQVIKKTRPS